MGPQPVRRVVRPAPPLSDAPYEAVFPPRRRPAPPWHECTRPPACPGADPPATPRAGPRPEPPGGWERVRGRCENLLVSARGPAGPAVLGAFAGKPEPGTVIAKLTGVKQHPLPAPDDGPIPAGPPESAEPPTHLGGDVRDRGTDPGFVALSRFVIANGMGGAVREAFRDRPHLVEGAEGFIRMDVVSPIDRPEEIWLITYWAGEESYQAWHRSHLHRDAHKGIPRGLKLLPGGTEVRFFEYISP